MKNFPKVIFIILGLSISPLSLATPLYYTFEGTINSVSSYNDSVSLSTFGTQLGDTTSYTFEVDFDRDTSSYTNSAGTWDYFYSDLLSGGIVNGEAAETNRSYNVVFNNYNSQGSLHGGSRVDIYTTDNQTSSWKVQDWYEGQTFNLLDGGYFSSGTGGAFYLLGQAKLVNISSTYSVPEPGTLVLLATALFGVFLQRAKFLRRSKYSRALA